MIEKLWSAKVKNIIKDCAAVGLPVDVEKDKNGGGIDASIEFGDIPFEKTGDMEAL